MNLADTNVAQPDQRRTRRPVLAALAVVLLIGGAAAVFAAMSGGGPVSDPPPHLYDVPPSMATTFAAQFAVRKLGWQVGQTDTANGTVVLGIPNWPKGTISVQAVPDGKGTRVVLHASSSTSGPDFGAKARHNSALALQAGMDDKLPELH